MNSGSSGIVTDDTMTTGTSGMGRAGVEAASCLQPGSPRTSRKPSTLNMRPFTRFCVVMFAIDRSSETIRSLRTFSPSRDVHNLIDDTACQATGGDELGPLLMDLLQQILPI